MSSVQIVYDLRTLHSLLTQRNELLRQFALDYWFDIELEYRRVVHPSTCITLSHSLRHSSNGVLCTVPAYNALKSLRIQIGCLLTAITLDLNVSCVLVSVLQGTFTQADLCESSLSHKVQRLLCLAYSSPMHKDIILTFRGEAAERVLSVMMNMMTSRKPLYPCQPYTTTTYRLSLRRLFLRLSKESGIIPSRLFISNIVCLDKEMPFGDGRFAEVFPARYDGQEVALKRLRVYQNRRNGTEDYESFCRELLVWSQLSHPNILPLLGADRVTFNPRNCMVSPWMRNGNVHDCMIFLHARGNKIPFERWLLEATLGLEYLHEEGIIHGDLRGANVMIDDYLHIRLADFGLAFYSDATTASLGSHFGGAARWMAPELFESENMRATYASDVYSFACLCVEILTRKIPFPYIANDIQVIAQVMKGKTPVRPVIQNGLLVPDDLWHLLQSCWFPTSTERPPARFIAEHMKAICSEDFAQPLPVQRRSKGISNAIACRAQSSANLLLGQTRCLREISDSLPETLSPRIFLSSNSAVLVLTNVPLLQAL